MFCGECGTQNPDTNQFCKNCGKPLARRQAPAPGPSPVPAYQPAPVPSAPQSPRRLRHLQSLTRFRSRLQPRQHPQPPVELAGHGKHHSRHSLARYTPPYPWLQCYPPRNCRYVHVQKSDGQDRDLRYYRNCPWDRSICYNHCTGLIPAAPFLPAEIRKPFPYMILCIMFPANEKKGGVSRLW